MTTESHHVTHEAARSCLIDASAGCHDPAGTAPSPVEMTADPPPHGEIMIDQWAAPDDGPPDIHAPMPWDVVPPEYLVTLLAVLIVAGAVTGTVRRALPGNRRAPMLPLRWRARLRLHPGPGFATDWELWRSLGLPAARRTARVTRPSLGWWDRHKPGGQRAYATYVGRAHGWMVPRRVYAGQESIMLVLAAPRQGKSAAAADRIIDHDGPVVAVSLRGDLVANTIRARTRDGRAAHILNPEGIGDYGTNMGYDPVDGAQDTKVAARRARQMVEASDDQGLSDSAFWQTQSAMILSGYLHAAALAGYTMRDVYEWTAGTDDTPLWILRRATGANPADRKNVANFLETMADRTKSSVVTTLNTTLEFMRDPAVAEVLDANSGLPPFDFETFLRSRDALYLVSNGAESSTRPLFAAFLSDLAHTAKRVSDTHGRLDPVLSMELDEIANTAPIPVPDWASWMGGAGIRMSVYAQNWAQLRNRYGDMANSLWTCAALKVIHGGTTEEELLEKVHTLTGTVTVRGRDRTVSTGKGRTAKERTEKEIPVLPTADFKLPKFTAVVLADEIPPTVVHTAKVWKRRDVKRSAGAPLPENVAAPAARDVPATDPLLRERVRARESEVVDPLPQQTLPDHAAPPEQQQTQQSPSTQPQEPAGPPPLRLSGSGTQPGPGSMHPAPWLRPEEGGPAPQRRPEDAPPREAMPWEDDER